MKGSTRKYQCAGPYEWGQTFQDAAGYGRREAEGIRAALAFAIGRPEEFKAFVEKSAVTPTGQLESRTLLPRMNGATDGKPAQRVASPDDNAVAAVVKQLVGDVDGAGRFGARKVFIAALWDLVQAKRPRFATFALADFKAALVRLLRSRDLVLARADLVAAMDPAMVERSEIRDQGATFHFVVDPDAKDSWQKPTPKVVAPKVAAKRATKKSAKKSPAKKSAKGRAR